MSESVESIESREYVLAKGVTKAILLALGTGAVIGTALIFPGIGLVVKEFNRERWNRLKKRGQLQSAIRRMEKQKLISWSEKDGGLALTLTKEGKKKILKYNIDELEIEKPKKWDKKWRVIIFDIPEKERVARDMLRGKLREMDFYQLQKSVFVSKYKCENEISFLSNSLGIAKYVTYIEASRIDGLK